MSWCTSWKYQRSFPVLRSSATRLVSYKLLPGRLPPYTSIVGDSTGQYTRPASGSADISVQTPVLPVQFHEPSSHVSFPGSPGPGIVFHRHSSLPVFTSYARTSPFALLAYSYRSPSAIDDCTTMVSLTTSGVE